MLIIIIAGEHKFDRGEYFCLWGRQETPPFLGLVGFDWTMMTSCSIITATAISTMTRMKNILFQAYISHKSTFRNYQTTITPISQTRYDHGVKHGDIIQGPYFPQVIQQKCSKTDRFFFSMNLETGRSEIPKVTSRFILSCYQRRQKQEKMGRF